MTDSSTTHGNDTELLLGRLAEEFIARRRAGERPTVDEYVARHPEHVASIRETLDTVAALEETEAVSGEELHAGLSITHIGDYRIEREIGRGGMGVVFLATDEKLDRQVALKLLPVQATLDARFLERFRREARAAAGLQHPNIVPVFGVGEHEGLHYYAMRYVEGYALDEVARAVRERGTDPESSDGEASSVESLARGLFTQELSDDSGSAPEIVMESREQTERPLALPTRGARAMYHRNVARLGRQAAGALAYAHARGILHRDVKPANLLLDERGRVWITDFGLCTTGEDSRLTMSTDMIGTLRYMAPEQVEGRADVRSDVYGLGITLYELLTLRPAFGGRDRAALMKHVVERSPVRPRRIDPEIPSDLEAIVLKAIAKLPEERYGTAEGLADDLRSFLEGHPIAARPPGALHLLRLAIRRNRTLAGTIAGAALVLITSTMLYVLGVQRARAEEVRQLYLANISAATASIEVDPRAAQRSLERAPVEHRNWEWQHLDARIDQSIATVAELEGVSRDLEATPDGSRLVTGVGKRLVVIDLDTSLPPRFSEPLPSEVVSVEIHPDGELAAVSDETDVLLFELAGEPRPIARRRMDSSPSAMCLDSTGERLYVGARTGHIHCFDSALNRQILVLRGHSGEVLALASTPDGGLVSAGADKTVRVWDPDSGHARVLSGHEAGIHSLDVSADGRLIGSGGLDGVIRLWELRSGALLAVWRGPAGRVELRFSLDGRYLVSSSDDRTLRVWDVRAAYADDAFALAPAPIRVWDPLRESALRKLAGHGAFVEGLAFHPDGRLFSSSKNGVVLEWDVEASGGLLMLVGHISDTWGLAFDATGTRLVSTSRDSTVRIWEARTGRPLRVLHSGSVPYGVSFSPDSREVAVLCRDGAVRTWDVDSGERLAQLLCPQREGSEQIQGSVEYDPTGARLFVVEHGQGLDAWQRTKDGWELERHQPVPGANWLDVSPDGSSVAIGTLDGMLRVIDPSDWTTRIVVQAHPGRIRSLAFHPDGTAIASAGPDGFAKVWRVRDGDLLASLPVRTDSASEGDIEGIDFSPDGSRLACVLTGSGVALWDPERGEHVTTLQGPGRGYNRAVFDPTGRRIISGSWGGAVRVWDTVTAVERSEWLRAEHGAFPGSPAGRTRTVHESFALLLDRVRRLLRSGELDPARIHAARWIGRGLAQEHVADPRASAVYGEALYRAGLLALSLTHLEASVETGERLGGASFDAFVFLSMVLARSGRLEAAEDALARARALSEQAPAYGAVGPRDLLAEAEQTLRAARAKLDG